MGLPKKKINDISFQKKRNKPPLSLVEKQPKYFIYIVTADAGSAPNPFHNFCTLAICKPEIRNAAQKGDWVIGLFSQAKHISQNYRGKLVYAMEVDKNITYNEYWNDKKFSKKKPNKQSAKGRCGDNIYHKNSSDHWIQKKGSHHNEKNIKGDTKRNAVLVSNNFFYLGEKCIHIPKNIKESINRSWQKNGCKTLIDQLGRNHKHLDKISGQLLIKWLQEKYKRKGRYGNPIGYQANNKGCETKTVKKTKLSHRGSCGPC